MKGLSWMQIIIRNKIQEKVEEYQEKHGSSKAWIANKMNITPQNLNKAFKSTNMPIEMLLRCSIVLECSIYDLFEYEIIE
jgi:DNA-binding Xre family transcriptional regulator